MEEEAVEEHGIVGTCAKRAWRADSILGQISPRLWCVATRGFFLGVVHLLKEGPFR